MDGSDTLYNGQVYKKINIIQHHLPGTIYDSLHAPVFFGGFRETARKIYIFQIWASVDTMPQLVYDFNHTNLGDTIYTNVLSGSKQVYGHVVTNLDSVLIGSNYHKRMLLQDTGSIFNTEYWIEGVGSSLGLPFATFWSITDNSYDLSCYNSTNQVVYQNPSPTFGMCTGTLPVISCKTSSSCDTVKNCQINKTLIQNANQLKSMQDSATYQWMNCTNWLPIAGDTFQTFTAQMNGSYAVIIKKDKCIDTSFCAEIIGMGYNDYQEHNFKLYPIPSKGRLYVDLYKEYSDVHMVLLNLQGQVLETWSFDNTAKATLDIQSPNGLYLLQIRTENQQAVYRVIKE